MNKRFQISLAILSVLTSFSLINGVYAVGNLSGTISFSPATPQVGNSFVVTVKGNSSVEEQTLMVDIYLKGGTAPIYTRSCWYSSTCEVSVSVPADKPGLATYSGYIRAEGSTSHQEVATVNISAAPSSPKPSSVPSPVQGTECKEGQICNPLGSDNFEDLINAVIYNFLIPVGIAVAGVMFVIAGAIFVTSAGDPGRAKTAKDIMLYTAIGLAVILVASGLIKVLQSLLGG